MLTPAEHEARKPTGPNFRDAGFRTRTRARRPENRLRCFRQERSNYRLLRNFGWKLVLLDHESDQVGLYFFRGLSQSPLGGEKRGFRHLHPKTRRAYTRRVLKTHLLPH